MKSDELPEQIPLATLVSWIVCGTALTPTELRARAAGADSRMLDKFRAGVSDNLRRLIDHIEMIAAGKVWDESDGLTADKLAEKQEEYEEARRTVERTLKRDKVRREKGREGFETAAEYAKAAREAVDADIALEEKWYGFLDWFFRSHCASGDGVMYGCPVGKSLREKIPRRFFMGGVTFDWNADPQRIEAKPPGSPDGPPPLDWILEYRDSPMPAYTDPLLERDQAERVKQLYMKALGKSNATAGSANSGGAPAKQGRKRSKKNLRRWYEKRVREWPSDKAHPNRNEDWAAAKDEFGWVPREAVLDLRRELAPEEWTKKGRRGQKRARN